MKNKAALGLAIACALSWSSSGAREQDFAEVPPPASASQPRLGPDLAEVVKMVRAKMTEEQVVANIKAWPRLFNVKPAEEKQLKALGVSPSLIAAMHTHDKELLRQWTRGAAGTVAVQDEAAQPRKVLAPKAVAGEDTPMRDERPLTFIRAPKASTNDVAAYRRPWTSAMIVEQAPPPPKLELAPDKPGEDYIWVTGHWEWRAGRWVWRSGKWLRRPGPGADWMDGYWQPHARGWTWVPGRWK